MNRQRINPKAPKLLSTGSSGRIKSSGSFSQVIIVDFVGKSIADGVMFISFSLRKAKNT